MPFSGPVDTPLLDQDFTSTRASSCYWTCTTLPEANAGASAGMRINAG